MKKLFLLLSIIVFLSVACDRNAVTSVPTPAANQQKLVDTSTWDTYQDIKHSFEFLYPENWTEQNNQKSPTSNIPLVIFSSSDGMRLVIGSDCCHEGLKEYGKKEILVAGVKQEYSLNIFCRLLDCSEFTDKKLALLKLNDSRLQNSQDYANGFQIWLEFSDNEEQAVDIFETILYTFRFTNQSRIEGNIYTNHDLGFSVQFPNDAPPSMELNSEYNRMTTFGKIPGKYFEVRLRKDIYPNVGVSYGHLEAEVVSTDIKLGGITGYKAISTTGYGDAGQQGLPFAEIGARHNGDVYYLIFFGDAIISPEESRIASSFKFTK